MTATRDTRAALESAQARLTVLRAATPTDEALVALADALDAEAAGFQALLARGERRVLKNETTNQAARVLAFGFSVLFMTPIVAMVGFSLARMLGRQPELSLVFLGVGVVLNAIILSQRARAAIAHRLSPDWNLLRVTRAQSRGLRALAARSSRASE